MVSSTRCVVNVDATIPIALGRTTQESTKLQLSSFSIPFDMLTPKENLELNQNYDAPSVTMTLTVKQT